MRFAGLPKRGPFGISEFEPARRIAAPGGPAPMRLGRFRPDRVETYDSFKITVCVCRPF